MDRQCTVGDVMRVFEEFAPSSLSESYDNVGILVGDAAQIINRCLISIDITEEVVDEAIAGGCNLIVSHHPILFGGIKRINSQSDMGRLLIKAIKNDIAIIAVHTNADRVFEGVSGRMAQKLGLVNCRILSPGGAKILKLVVFVPQTHADKVRDAMFMAGAGTIGNYDCCSFNSDGFGTFRAGSSANPFVGKKGEVHREPEVRVEVVLPSYLQQSVVSAMLGSHPYEEVAYDIFSLENKWSGVGYGIIGELPVPEDETVFLARLKNEFSAGCIRHTSLLGRPVGKVALCGGSGSFLLGNAIGEGADIFVTGDFKYHQFFEAEGKVIIADIGHYESEQFTKELFFELLTKKISNFALCLSKVNTNPIKYF
jgi:dinuclear metal center YbgI/SA1388 family protein